MKKINDKVYLLYTLLLIYIALKNIVFIPISQKIFMYYINQIMLILICIYCYIFLKKVYGRYKHKIDKMQIVIIIMMVYGILYFSSGLIIGYQYSPYAHDLISILKNFYVILLPTILIEYIRFCLSKNSSNKYHIYILNTILFSLIEINFLQFFQSFNTLSSLFEYFSSILIPLVIKNGILFYLIKEGGILTSMSYIIPLTLIQILFPIFPKYNWFMEGAVGCLLPLFIYLSIDKFVNRKDNRKLSVKKQKTVIKNIPTILILVILIIFFRGYFHYRPISVMSNSMYPLFSRGDVVIAENINDKNIKTIKIGDIIVYKLDNIEVIHRVIDIKTIDGVIGYQLKGDNNNGPDTDLVYENQILAIEKFSIPYLGYPSVIISSIFSHQQVNVETGK